MTLSEQIEQWFDSHHGGFNDDGRWLSREDVLALVRAHEAQMAERLRQALTTEVIRAISALRQAAHVCREQDGQTVFVSGPEAAREYAVETLLAALTGSQPERRAK